MPGVSVIHDQSVRGARIQDSDARFVHEDFKGHFAKRSSAANDGEPTGTAGDVNIRVGDRNCFEQHVLGTQTILGPVRTSSGLNITQDLTADDGIEYTLGNEQPANTVISNLAGATRGTFVVGTDPNFYFALKFTLADVSGTDDCAAGWRKAEAYQANIDDYDEAAWLNVIAGAIKIETILNNAATTTTDTTNTWTNTQTKTLMVIVDSDGSLSNDGTRGKVYFNIDGVKPTAEAASRYKFDVGEIVIPFFFFLNDTNIAEATTLKQWQSGFLPVGETAQYQLGAA